MSPAFRFSIGVELEVQEISVMATSLFPLGRTYITPGALEVCQSFPMPPDLLFVRHASGDWREMDQEDQRANREAIEEGSRVFSAYQVGQHRFFVITEADRSTTTILLAEEY